MSSDELKVKPGDRVLVECEAIAADEMDWQQRDEEVFDLLNMGQTALRALRIHSVLPRPISVGDEVLLDGIVWKVLCIDDSMAWLREATLSSHRPPIFRSEMLALLSTLTPVESPEPLTASKDPSHG